MVSHKQLKIGLKGVKAKELSDDIFKGLHVDTDTTRCKYEHAGIQILHFAKLGFPNNHEILKPSKEFTRLS